MATPQSKDGYISIPSLGLPPKPEQDIEKAAPPPEEKVYGTFSMHNESKIDMQPAQAQRSPLGYVLIPLIYSLLVVGAFTMGAFIVVSVFL